MTQLTRRGSFLLFALTAVSGAWANTPQGDGLVRPKGKLDTSLVSRHEQRMSWSLAVQAHTRRCIGADALKKVEVTLALREGGWLAKPPAVTFTANSGDPSKLVAKLQSCAPFPDPIELPESMKDSTGSVPVHFRPSVP